MNHVASGLNLKPGDEVLTTNHEHAAAWSAGNTWPNATAS